MKRTFVKPTTEIINLQVEQLLVTDFFSGGPFFVGGIDDIGF